MVYPPQMFNGLESANQPVKNLLSGKGGEITLKIMVSAAIKELGTDETLI
jgi:hypothetical protein